MKGRTPRPALPPLRIDDSLISGGAYGLYQVPIGVYPGADIRMTNTTVQNSGCGIFIDFNNAFTASTSVFKNNGGGICNIADRVEVVGSTITGNARGVYNDSDQLGFGSPGHMTIT